jgi:glucosamine kinase
VVVGTDVEAAFYEAFGEGPGILLVAGTGSVAWGRGPLGRTARVGGWGQLLGDEGSGYAIGLGALRAVARAEDGRGPPTSLRSALLEALSVTDVGALVPWAAAASKAEVARLAPLVARAAEEGDSVADRLLADAALQLEGHVAAVLERTGPWAAPPEVVLWGGIVGEKGPLRARVAERLAGLPVTVAARVLDPALGAARLALRGLA